MAIGMQLIQAEAVKHLKINYQKWLYMELQPDAKLQL